MLTGGCLCGDAAFEIDGPVDMMIHCHCSMCRKFHGSAFATYPLRVRVLQHLRFADSVGARGGAVRARRLSRRGPGCAPDRPDLHGLPRGVDHGGRDGRDLAGIQQPESPADTQAELDERLSGGAWRTV